MTESRTVLIVPRRYGDRGAPFAPPSRFHGKSVVTSVLRYIVHVDLDAFYASVEELDHPEYRGHPLVVGADPQEGRGRGVVATANYAARKFGIRSAMPIGEAWRRCPDARFVFPRFERYAEESDKVFAIVRAASDVVEQAGIDEGYLDLSEKATDFPGAVALARKLQAEVERATGLTCSMGVSTSKTVAKIATDMQKPRGLTAVPPGTEEEFLRPLPVRKIPGVGPKSEAHLQQLGIETCGQLATLAPSLLAREFGAWGPRLGQLARGIDPTPLETGWERKSVGGETTFLVDSEDPDEWRSTVEQVARDAAASLVAEGSLARTVTLKVRLSGFETYTRARTIPQPTDDASTLARVALDLLAQNPPARAVRLLGVRLSQLVPREGPAQRVLDEWDAARMGEAPPWRPRQRRLDE